jgi:hypothetical protein
MSVDFPRAWQIARSVPWQEHDIDCSFFLTDAAILCDCPILTQHPDYIDDVLQSAEVAPEETL